MNDATGERRAMIDTDELKRIVKDAVKEADHCHFSEKERVTIRALSEVDPNILARMAILYADATNNIIKGIIAIAFFGALAFAAVGAYFKFGGK